MLVMRMRQDFWMMRRVVIPKDKAIQPILVVIGVFQLADNGATLQHAGPQRMPGENHPRNASALRRYALARLDIFDQKMFEFNAAPDRSDL